MKRKIIGPVITTAVLLGLGIFAVWLFMERPATECGFCQRPIQTRALTIAEIGGRRVTVCCLRCAVSESHQEGKPLRLIQVTDYAAGNKLDPERGFYVDGSRKVLCSHDAPLMDQTKHSMPMAFDRCSPGAYAFARREDAEQFVEENGGVIRTLPEMLVGGKSQ